MCSRTSASKRKGYSGSISMYPLLLRRIKGTLYLLLQNRIYEFGKEDRDKVNLLLKRKE